MQLTNHFGSAEGAPKWSPDGRSIAFTSFQSDNADIWLMDADAGRKRRLTHWPSIQAEPSWTRDGRSIYFRSERTGTSEIWRVPVAGGEPEQITTQGGYLARESADGKLLYYTKQPSSPLFAKALGSSAETQVLDWVHQRSSSSPETVFTMWAAATRIKTPLPWCSMNSEAAGIGLSA